MKKKILSLALALVMILALAVPALAEESKELTLEELNLSVAPIGIAKIQRQYDLFTLVEENVYVFDQYCEVSLKDGRKFTEWTGNQDGGPIGPWTEDGGWVGSQTFQFSPDGYYDYEYYLCQIQTADGGYFRLISKVALDNIAADERYTVDVQPIAGQSAEPAAPAEAGTHIAKAGDTWGELALNNYGTFEVWPQLMKANGGKPVSVGMKITLPEKIGSYSLLAEQVLAEGETLYTVKAGDTLGQIALATYGDMSLYKIIYERNKDRLTSPAMIYGGQTLVLPVKPAAQAPAQPAEQEPAGQQPEQPVSFAKGDKVTVREGAKTYTGGNLAGFVYRNTYTVIAVNGDRVVIGVNGVATAAMNAADLIGAK